MKKILLATQNQNDMTSFLRTWGIFTHESLKNICTPIRRPEDARWVEDWTYFREADVVYHHRPGSVPIMDAKIIHQAKLHKIPLWVDLDDDLQNITMDNPVYSNYASEEAKTIIDYAIREADVLTVGGERHKARLEKEYKRKVILIPNAVDDKLLQFKKPFKFNKRVAWRGSESHRVDLNYFQDDIAHAMEMRPDWEWCFFGFYPYQFEWLTKTKFKWAKKLNLMEYYGALTNYNACLHIVPLLDTEFNRVKSNLCWSDATLAGSLVLGPSFEEYKRPGVYCYQNKADFSHCLDQILGSSSIQDMVDDHNRSWEWIKDNILVSKVNEIRKEILVNL